MKTVAARQNLIRSEANMSVNSDHVRYLELLERTNSELNIMVEIGKTLTSSLDLQEVLEIIMQKIGQLLKPKA